MARESEKKEGRLGRLLSGLNRKDTTAVEEETQTQPEETIAPPEEGPSIVETILSPEDYQARRLTPDGALLHVWERWAGRSIPPILSLTGDDDGRILPLSEQELPRERVRLKAQLEKDAKKRIRALDENEKKGGGPLDAQCQVYVSRYGMVAWAFVFPPSSPEGKLRADSIGKALQDANITSGIDSTAVVRLFQEDSYFQLIPVAAGTPAIEGESGKVIEHYPRKLQMEIKVDENGVADYRSLNYVQMIEPGRVICDIVPPKEGVPGLRVDGKVIEPKPVKPAKLPAGSNTAVTEDGLHLAATLEGHLEFVGGAFHVRPVLEVKGDVDYATGNIEFRGDVHIRGDVRENFCVRATGTVTIDGLVEAATIEAGGDLTITCGVLGDNRALIKSGGSIRAKYLESCVTYAGKCVYADCIMSSQVFSDDAIDVTTGRGTVIGGALTAAHTVKARIIGCQSGRKTEITLGVLPYAQETMLNHEADLSLVREEIKTLEKNLAYLETKQGLEGSSQKLAKAHLRRSVLGMKESQLLKQLERLRPMTPDLSKCRLEGGVIYPITVLTIQDVTWRTDQIKSRCKVIYNPQTEEIKEI